MRTLRLSAFVIVALLAPSAAAQPSGRRPAARPVPAARAPAAPVPATPAPAPAAPVPAASALAAAPLAEALTGDAKADYESAKLLYVDGDYAGALVKFTGAYDNSKDPRLLWNIAACEKNLRHYASVLGYVREYLKEGDAALSPEDKAEAEELIAAIEPFTAALEVAVSEPGAKVYVDERLVGETPLERPITVDIGVRKLRVVKDGYEELTKDVAVGGSPKLHVDARLEKIVHEGRLVVNARPKDEIFIDGERVGLGTWSGVLPSGGHTLRVSAPEMRAYQSEILVRDKETRNVSITLDREVKPGGGVPTWVWIGGGAILAAGAAVGGYFIFKPEDRQPTLPVGTLEPGTLQASLPGLPLR